MSYRTYIYAVITFLIVDAIWLSIMTPILYQPALQDTISDTFRWLPALIFYVVYAIGIVALIIKPAYNNKTPLKSVILRAAFFGALAYGTYELTNYATIASWPLHVVFIDILWGSSITAFVAFIVYSYAQNSASRGD